MSNRIMVVDDDSMAIKMCDFILKKEGYEVIAVNSGTAALEYLENSSDSKIDLIFLDNEMPVMNGYETLAAIKSNDSTKNIPVVFLTATITDEVVDKATSLGAASYLRKPFKPAELSAKAKEIL